jgi:phage terminase small subunit
MSNELLFNQDDCPERHALTPMQQRFTLNVFEHGNAAQAYRDAGYKVQTDDAAYAAASRLLGNVKVQAFLNWLQQKAIEASIMSVTERKQRLSEIGRGRITDFIEVKDGVARIKVDLESVNSGAVQEVTTEELDLGKGKAPTIRVTKLKLYQPGPAIDLLNKMEGQYSEINVNIDNRKIELFQVTDEQLEAIAAGSRTGTVNSAKGKA